MGLITNVTRNLSIAAGAALSGAIACGQKTLCGIQMPAAWTAANITFQTSVDGTTWSELHDPAGNAVQIVSPAASEYRALDTGIFTGLLYLKVRSGTAATPVNQVAAAPLQLVFTKLYPVCA